MSTPDISIFQLLHIMMPFGPQYLHAIISFHHLFFLWFFFLHYYAYLIICAQILHHYCMASMIMSPSVMQQLKHCNCSVCISDNSFIPIDPHALYILKAIQNEFCSITWEPCSNCIHHVVTQ